MTAPARSRYRRLEQLMAIGSFGAASAFALGIAFILPPTTYGRMMTVQAAIVVVVSVATLRTHDLAYFSIEKYALTPHDAFRTGARIELASLVAIVAAVLVIQTLAASLVPAGAAPVFVLGAAVLIALGSMQGASVARLRQAGETRVILVAEAACIAAWIAAAGIVLAGDRDIGELLVIAASPQAFRYLVVLVGAMVQKGTRSSGSAVPLREVASFLGTGQVANALKNANTSIETMLVAAFFGPVTVAMYRIARAVQGAPTAALNVLQQRSYADLAAAEQRGGKRTVRRRLAREAVLLTALFLPLCVAVAAVFAWFKPAFGMAEFAVLSAALYLSLFPAAFQQAALAILAMAGRNAHLGMAYVAGAAVLALGGAAMLALPHLWILVLTVILAALVRAVVIERQAERVIDEKSLAA